MSAADLCNWLLRHEGTITFARAEKLVTITVTARGHRSQQSFTVPSLDIPNLERFDDMAALAVECAVNRLDILVGS